MANLPEFLEKFNSRFPPFQGCFRFNEPMAEHTTFKVGGPADLWIRPEGDFFPGYVGSLMEAARKGEIPLFILGGGANLVVADRGIRGIVLDCSGYFGLDGAEKGETGTVLSFKAGTKAEEAAETAADRGLEGLDFLAGMPGTLGGALWMNARCYDREISDVVREVRLLERGGIATETQRKEDYGYKKSPFQGREALILSASFSLRKGDPSLIRAAMESRRKDREAKGHYRFPSAGSAFKNNRSFGKPVGKIIDELGLRGFALGDAQVAPWHGNIIINRGRARAADIRALTEELKERVKTALGLVLEPEIIFAGDF
jgi:UDP-N-acetylmuramate dehydrogenase